MRWWVFTLFPVLAWGQDFPFQQEKDTVPVTVGSWQPFCPWTEGLSYSRPAFGDVDLDNDYDLVVGSFQESLFAFQNQGYPTEASFAWLDNSFLPIDSLQAWVSPEFCDLNGDGDGDMLLSDNSGCVRYFENQSTGGQIAFAFVADSLTGTTIVSWITTTDIDADGDQDLFTGAYYGNIYFFENIGTAEEYNFTLVTSNFDSIDVGYFSSPTFCDIDADGDYDLFAGDGEIPGPPGLHLYLNRGTPQNPDYVLYSSNLVPNNYFVIITPTLADIDADGDFDLFIFDDWGDLYFYENTGTSSDPHFEFITQNWQGINEIDHRYARFYDIDADGDLDLFYDYYSVANQHGNVRFYENIGMPQSANMVWVTDSYLPFEVMKASCWFCDIDADNLTDLFVSDMYGGILFFHGIDSTQVVIPAVQRHPLAGTHLSIGPNPANPVTFITFSLPYPQEATLVVYNLLGARVTTLTSGLQPPGEQSFLWDARGKASGVYIVKLEAAGEVQAGKIVVVK